MQVKDSSANLITAFFTSRKRRKLHGMKFDFFSITASLSILDISVAIIMLYYVLVLKPKKWFIYTYSLHTIIEAIAIIGLSLHSKIPDFISLYVCNILFFLSRWLEVISITSYRGKLNKSFAYLQSAIIIIFSVVFFLTINNPSLSVIINGTGIFMVYIYTSFYLLKNRKPYNLPILLAIGYFWYAAINLLRSIDIAIHHYGSYDFKNPTSFDMANYIYGFLFIVITTIGFLLLINEIRERYIEENNLLIRKSNTELKDANDQNNATIDKLKQLSESLNDTNHQLKTSEESLKEAQQIGNVGHWEYDNSQDKLYWSEQTFRIYDVDLNDFEPTFEHVTNLFHPDDRQKVINTFNNSVSNKMDLEVSHRIVTKTGKVKYITQRAVTKYDNSGNPLSTIGSVQDITEMKKGEISMHARLELNEYSITHTLHDVLQKTLDLIIDITESKIGFYHFVDDDQKNLSLQAWSTNTVKNYCHAKPETGHYSVEQAGVWADCVNAKEPVVHNDYMSLSHKKGLPVGHAALIRELVVPILRNDKVVAILGVGNKEGLYDESDIVFVNFFADVAWKIVEQKRTEEQIAQKNKELLELNIAKDKFISIISHDLKGPIITLNVFLQRLEKNIRNYSIEKIENHLHVITSSMQNTQNLLIDILTWARAQSNKIPFNPEKHSLEFLCNNVVENLELSAKNKNIEFKCLVGNDIQVDIDKDMINTVLRNLISNAIKFTNNGGHITINAEQNHSIVTVTVSDNGIGIEAETVTKLFDISHHITTTGTANETGTGIGLLLCKEFIEIHGGKIWVESEIDKGSDFKFTIPLSKD